MKPHIYRSEVSLQWVLLAYISGGTFPALFTTWGGAVDALRAAYGGGLVRR